jgi:hypothetical protein
MTVALQKGDGWMSDSLAAEEAGVKLKKASVRAKSKSLSTDFRSELSRLGWLNPLNPLP